MKKAICFLFSKEFFYQGINAIISAKLHNPDHTTILLTDNKTIANSVDIILSPEDIIGLEKDNWLMVGRIAVVQHALSKLNFDTAIFIDGDTYTYHNYDSLQQELNTHSILVIPHITQPLPNDGLIPTNNNIVLAGNYNTGVWGASKDGLDFLSWWKDYTALFPIMNPGQGFFNEQGWLRFAADFEEKTKIFRHPGYNVAYWNIKQRYLEFIDNMWYIDHKPLSVVHFSGLHKEINPSHMSRYQNRYVLTTDDPAYILYKSYHDLVWGTQIK